MSRHFNYRNIRRGKYYKLKVFATHLGKKDAFPKKSKFEHRTPGPLTFTIKSEKIGAGVVFIVVYSSGVR